MSDLRFNFIDIYRYTETFVSSFVLERFTVYIYDLTAYDQVLQGNFVAVYLEDGSSLPKLCRIAFPDVDSVKKCFENFIHTEHVGSSVFDISKEV